MNDEVEIELQADSVPEAEQLQLPMNFLRFGEVERDDVHVYIHQKVYRALERYAASDISTELGTILIGDYGTELGATHVVVSDYIEAKYADASASTLTFTHETWAYVHEQHDSRFPERKIVGWQHTHPSYGIFLSNYDLFIHENFFNLPFQIAYVIDPVQKLRGFFQWKDGKIEKLKGFYIYDEVGKAIQLEEKQTSARKETPRAKSAATPLLLSLLVITWIGILVLGLSFGAKYRALLRRQQEILDQLSGQSAALSVLQSQISGESSGNASLLERIQAQEQALEQLQDTVASIEQERAGQIVFRAYTVVAGDTLENICAANGIEYLANKGIILSVNGIENPNQIYVGQTILLPVFSSGS